MAQRPLIPVVATALRRCAWLSALAALAVLLLAPAGGQAARSAKTIAPEQQLATVHVIKDVHASPVIDSQSLSALADQRPLTLTTTTLPVLDQMTDPQGRQWLQVRLPGRVFHRKTPPPTGWITADEVTLSTTPWHLVIDIRTRRVLVYRAGRRVRAFKVIVGKPSTPTPRGEFFVEEAMRLSRKHVGYPYALATSARSKVFKEFMGGPGQIALHGVTNIGGTMGTAVSNGCIRMTSAAIMWLAQRIKAGVPLTIR